MLQEEQRKEPRKKKWAPKVRSGCLVCRARRVKCDETKPICKRCQTARRSCRYDTYIYRKDVTPAVIVPRLAHNVSPFPGPPRPYELHLFVAFKDHVVPHMSDFFDRDFWQVSMLHGIRAYPAAWYASLAVGAMYEQLRLRGGHGGGKSAPRWQYYENAALTYCNKTARLLVEASHTHMTMPEREMLLVSCILLICYASLRRDSAQTLTHTYNGVYLSKKWNYWQQNNSSDKAYRLPNCVLPVSSVSLLFRRLEMQLFSSPLNLLDLLSKSNQPMHIAVDIPYESATEAYIELQSLANSRRYIQYQASHCGADELPLRAAEAASVRKLFLLWSQKFQTFEKSYLREKSRAGEYPDLDEEDRIRALTLWELGGRIMSCADGSKGKLAVDDYKDELYRSLYILEYFLDASPLGKAHTSSAWLPNLSSFMSLMSQLLRFICSSCRIPTIRRRCLRLLANYPFIDGTMDNTYAAELARAKMELEENGWQRTPIQGGCDCVPDVFICGQHRIPESAIQTQKGSSRVTLQSCYEVANGLPGSIITIPSKSKDTN